MKVMYLKRLEDFTPEVALAALKEHISKSNYIYDSLSINNLNLIQNGINDKNIIKYVLSVGYGIYQIVAIDTHSQTRIEKRVAIIVKHSALS